MAGLRIGLLVDTALKRQYLALSAREAGHELMASLLLSDCPSDVTVPDSADAWVVDVALDPEADPPAPVQALLEYSDAPLIISDSSEYRPGSEEHNAWLKRTLAKLRQLAGDINLRQVPRAQELWVLAASTGGPAAVKRFLASLPPDLNVAFVYVQHIDTSYTGTLVRMMSQSHYPAALASDGAVLQANQTLIVTACERVDLLDNGTLATAKEPWGGPYAPSVDQLVANAARVYGERLGLIVFTGMGDDGAAACRLVRQRGGRVWAQTPDSCTSASMPDAALATGTVETTGTPVELANSLSAHCRASARTLIEEVRPYESPTAH